MTDMKAAEAHRTELISRMDLKVVGDREVENENQSGRDAHSKALYRMGNMGSKR
jgi:hypothetical protein